MAEIHDYFKVCEAAARAGGQSLREWRYRVSPREKSPKDLVTEADLASQRAVEQIVLAAYPSHGFVGEETPLSAAPAAASPDDPEATWRWIVDPLDGTANFVHGLLPFCVSVALARGDEIVVGVVYDPIQEECFGAQAGGGASLNGQRLQVSHCRELRSAMVASSFSANVERGSEELARFSEVIVECQTLRRLGSAALNLCYVAAGRLDAYWATSAKNWDVAAGVLIAREAGAVITSVDGTPFQIDHPRLVGAATPELHAELVRVLARGSK